MAVNYIVRFYRQVDEVWAVSRKTAMTLKNYGYRGDVFIMPNGSDFVIPDDIESYRMQAIQFLDIKDDEPTLLFVGHLIWQKNIKFMFEVLRHLDSEGFKYHMIFIGEGGHEKMVKKYYESLNLAGRVTFGGGVRDRYLLAGIFVASDLFFFPSVYDNAPLVIREAASAGLPSLLARGSHSAEVVVDNVSGFTERLDAEKMAARIIDLFKNPKLLKEVGEAAKTTIPTTWSVFVKQAIERYQQVMERYYRYEE
jgi:glycosyltransferase involved in cell wall biosynthesis